MPNQNDKIKQLLVWFSHKILAKYKPLIIGITGSVGKTSTRHAIAAALSAKYHLREPEKNYNNEIGIPLTIIGARGLDEGGLEVAGFKFGWLRVFMTALTVWLLPHDYPKLLVLEYGIDHPGDMDKLINIARPKIGVITTIGISHREHFNNEAEIAHEKGKLAAALPKNGIFVYNANDAHIQEQTKRTQAHVLSYGRAGTDANPDVVLEKVEETLGSQVSTTLLIKSPVRELKISVPVVGTAHQEAILAAVAVAEALQMDTELILKGLQTYRAIPGRLNILAGIKRTVLIDDSYNAAPLSMKEALNLLGRFPSAHKVAVLGDMLELGDEADQAHTEIGRLAASMNLQELVTVGDLGKKISDSALQAGMPKDSIIHFENSEHAKLKVLQDLQPESVVLIKGSQGARMEKITKELLAEPMGATHLLVRQYGHWLE